MNVEEDYIFTQWWGLQSDSFDFKTPQDKFLTVDKS